MLTTYSILLESMYKLFHTCHTRSTKEPGNKSYHTRIPYDFRTMSRISADIKWMLN